MEQPTLNASPGDAYKPTGPLAGQRKLYIALAVLGLALGYFSYIAFQGAAVFYVTVDELVSGTVTGEDTIRVSGRLVPDSFQREAQGTVAHFDIAGGGQVLPAVYDGTIPSLFFDEHSEIVLEGSYDSEGMFTTSLIIVKCPSKYEALAQEEQTEV